MNDVIHWTFGPQLIGIIMLFAGYIQQKYPPTDIDGSYGFRTATSRKSQEAFDEGNRYSAKLMVRLGLIALPVGLILVPFIDFKHEYIMILLTMLSMVVLFGLMFSRTNAHLKKLFNS